MNEPDVFEATATYSMKGDRPYRITIRPNGLIFIRLATPVNPAIALQFGLVGMIFHHVSRKKAERKSEAIRQRLAAGPVEALLDEDSANFRLALDEVAHARIEVPGFWYKVNHGNAGKIVGVLHLKLHDRPALKLAFLSSEAMRAAVEGLPAVLGDRLDVAVVWEARKGRFVRLIETGASWPWPEQERG